MALGRGAGRLLLLLALGVAACGGGGEDRTPGAARGDAPASGVSGRPSVEDQLAIVDDSRTPEVYTAVLTSLAQKCRESRIDLADAVVSARRTLEQERGVTVTVLDYLRGIDATVPAGRTGVDCTAVAAELGRTLGR